MRKRRVQFTKPEAKPRLALNLLQEIFNSQSDQKCIFSKNVPCLINLFEFLSRIKVIILHYFIFHFFEGIVFECRYNFFRL